MNRKNIDITLIENSIKNILIALGEDIDREGLKETPKRVAKMYEERFEGIRYTNDDLVEIFGKTFECPDSNNDIVIVKDIPTFSFCEHHMALMYNMKVDIAYVPDGKVIGLSKIYRIVDMIGRRLQIQERIGEDIAYVISKIVGNENVIVVVEAEHSCITTRGIKINGGRTKTICARGVFMQHDVKMKALLQMIN